MASQTPYEAGYNLHQVGIPKTENPYEPGTDEYDEWNAGHDSYDSTPES